jgi:uncharacterized protein (DUF305 family)
VAVVRLGRVAAVLRYACPVVACAAGACAFVHPVWRTVLAVAFACVHAADTAAQVPIVQPGAPGSPSRVISAAEASDLSKVSHTAADIAFMQGMLGHHAQALEMTALRPTRSRREDLRLLALRIELSQADEIKMMERWLKDRGAPLPDPHAQHTGTMKLMPGMLTTEEMARLAAANGDAFDRLFLEFMIKHHQGAVQMVEGLFATSGAGQESSVFAFASDVVDDQQAEMSRMAALLKELQP